MKVNIIELNKLRNSVLTNFSPEDTASLQIIYDAVSVMNTHT